ncbi:endolytic transglycosylase MltG [Latilactobacillus fuchuensis]|uniref:endolytic transglycosylase MltG n=1 Tax=Latilactobacillus fuchuensis TaxID=164393 RepID=UPI000468E730|nr:endolytic transglycosylase MltG [Latilactobacillus fuchuensis]MCP8857823.1 endolytic transglycosylase MltG [Latilactobacillus fuchuensis]
MKKADQKEPVEQTSEQLYAERRAEKKAANKIVYWIIGIALALVVIIGLMGYRYVQTSLKPYNATAKTEITVKIPNGSTNKEIAAILQEKKLIKSATVFNYYVKTHNFSDFQAGYHVLKQSMGFEKIISNLQKEGTPTRPRDVTGKVLVKEGVTLEEIATAVGKNTKYSKADFIKLIKDKQFLASLKKKYPELLTSTMAKKNVRYHLEGYLFPATYEVYKDSTLKEIVTEMVKTTDQNLRPYYATIKSKKLTVQEVLTLASLVEREGVTASDRQKIAGVFFNRLDIDMPIQSDISVMYALNTHKTHLYNKDVQVDSPYNLYVHSGYGPGPFNSPSLQSVTAVLNPSERDQDYLYFVANLKTGEVYYSHTLDEHTQTTNSIED